MKKIMMALVLVLATAGAAFDKRLSEMATIVFLMVG